MSLESSRDRHIFSILRLRRKSTSTDTEQLLMIPTHSQRFAGAQRLYSDGVEIEP